MKKTTTQKKKAGCAAIKTRAKKNPTAEERYCLVQKAAYLRAEKDGFQRDPCRYWLEAEAAIDAQLARGK